MQKNKPRSFFDNIDKWAKEQGASGLAYFTIEKDKHLIGTGLNSIGETINFMRVASSLTFKKKYHKRIVSM